LPINQALTAEPSMLFLRMVDRDIAPFEPLGSAAYRAMHKIAASRRLRHREATSLPIANTAKDADYANSNIPINDRPR
jgi:hypothetical protein